MNRYLLIIILLINLKPLVAQTEREYSIEKLLKENNIPVLGLGIIEDGKLSSINVYGNIKPNEKAPYNTIFNVASITKTVTSAVALKLISEKKWKLDEPLHKYWIDPDITNNSYTKLITTRYVLTHQTGFPNWRTGKLNFLFKPGTKCSYSGEGFEYLRIALEKKFGKTLNKLAEELLFEPLKMKDTQFVWSKKIDESRVVEGVNNEGKPYKTYKRKISNGADDLLTTVEDYSAFLINIITGEGLSQEIVKEMYSDQVAFGKKHFGLGFVKYNFKDGNYALSHGGSDNGVQTLMVMLPKTKKGIIIFTNADNGYKVYEKLLNRYLRKYGAEIMEIETGKKVSSSSLGEVKKYTIKDQQLYNKILAKDKEFFDAYNNCDMKKQAEMYDDKVEFFHDKAGLMNNKEQVLNTTEKNICDKVTRTLIENSVEVYPIEGYGAIQIGYHKFFNNQEPNAISSPSKFIITWHYVNDSWKISKVISLH